MPDLLNNLQTILKTVYGSNYKHLKTIKTCMQKQVSRHFSNTSLNVFLNVVFLTLL